MPKPLNITVEESGERLYIFPCSRKANLPIGRMPLLFLDPESEVETELYEDVDNVAHSQNTNWVNSSFWFKLRVAFSTKFHGIWFWLTSMVRNRKYIWRDFPRYFWDTQCVFAEKWSGIRISVPRQLMLNDPERLADIFYLPPSQKYLEQRVQEWLNNEQATAWLLEQQNNLKVWMEAETNQGRQIIYVASVDT